MKFIKNLLGSILSFLLIGVWFSPFIYLGFMQGSLGFLLIGVGGWLYVCHKIYKEEKIKNKK
jgi:hypothetical protein